MKTKYLLIIGIILLIALNYTVYLIETLYPSEILLIGTIKFLSVFPNGLALAVGFLILFVAYLTKRFEFLEEEI